MPNLEQLPEATAANPTDLIMLAQSGTSSSVTVETLLTGLQPQLTLAQNTLLGRVSITPGEPEPVAIGPGVRLAAGVLSADTSVIAPLASPDFTGTPTAPTPAVGDVSNTVATTAFVQAKYFQPLTLAGDITGTASPYNSGTVDASLPAITTPGTFTKVAVNAKGQVTGGSSTLTPADIAGFEAAVPVQSVAGQIGAVTDLSAGTVIAVGAANARALFAAAGLQLDAVLDFGADPTGTTDSTAAIQNGIHALQAVGSGVLRCVGQFKISSTLTVTSSFVGLTGAGAGQISNENVWTAPSRLFWAGASGGTICSVAPVVNTISGRALIGNVVEGILFDCMGLAACGLYVGSVRHGTFDVGYLNPIPGNATNAAAGVDSTGGVVFDTVDIAEWNDCQFNHISICGAELGSGGQGVVLQGKSRNCTWQIPATATYSPSSKVITVNVQAVGYVVGQAAFGPGIPAGTTIVAVSGTSVTLSAYPTLTQTNAFVYFTPWQYYGNTSYNNIKKLDLHNWRGVALTLAETDNNVFDLVCINSPPAIPANYTVPPQTSAYSLTLQGGSTQYPFPATENIFVHVGCASPMMCYGTEKFAVPSGYNNSPNIFLHLDYGNSPQFPTLGTGALAFWSEIAFIDYGKGGVNSYFSDNRVNLLALRAAIAAGGGAVFHASAGTGTAEDAALRLVSSDFSKTWTLAPASDGSLNALSPTAASAPLRVGQIGGVQIELNGNVSGSIPAINAYSNAQANVSLILAAQGTSSIILANGNGEQFQISDSGGAAEGFLSVYGAKLGNAPGLQAFGQATNIDIDLTPQGTGLVRGPTAASTDNSTAFATTAFVNTALSGNISAGSATFTNLAVTGATVLNAATINSNGATSAFNSTWTSGNPGNGAFQWNVTGAVPSTGVIGPLTTIYNNGPHCAQGAKYTYFSTAGAADSVDNAQTQIAIFNPAGMSGINIGDELVRWTVGITPEDITHNWTHVVEEYNVVNRGLDIGWKAYRNDPVNNITGPQQITGIVNYSPEATGLGQPGEGKNLLFAELFGQSEATNSTGLPARFYNASLYEPNCVVGGTGRAIYINGDVTGLAPQVPYAPLEVSLTWLHGLRTTSATFTDGAALTMASGQQVAWSNATSTASITASGSGANQSITLTPAGTGTVAIAKLQGTGGTLDNTPIGATTASTGAFTTLKSTTLTAATSAGLAIGTAEGTVLDVTDNGTAALSKLVVTPGNGGQPPVIAVSGETNQGLVFRGAGTGQINFQSGSGGNTNSLTILPNASAVNALSIAGGSTGQNVVLGVNGSDTNVTIQLVPQGTGTVYINKLQGAGGSIDNTPVGASTPSTAAVTTLKTTGLASFTAGIADASFSSQTPTTGFAITVANGVSTLQLTPAGTLASGTITMPSSPGNGQWLLVTSTAAVTACTFTPASGQTLLGAPTTLPAFVEMAFQYQASGTRWICQSGNDSRVASVFSAAALMFGTGADGAVTISSGTTTLTRDMHYTNLTLSGTGVLNPAGWRVFANGTLDVSAAPAGAIVSNGTAANNASGATAGAAPSGLSLRTVGQSPSTGGNGGNGSTTTGTAGTAGASITYGNGGNGGAAGSGGTATSAGGAAGSGGAQTVQIQLNTPTLTFWSPADNAGLACGLIGGGGGGGGGDATNAGGGGGSGGSYGGTIALYARNIQRGTNATTSIIQAKGSNGGTGANGVAGNAAGGGGGGGGGGGLIYIITETLLGSSIANALDVSGGTGGTGGNGSGTGKGGNGGTGGAGGSVQILNLLTPTFTSSAWNTAGTTGATTSTSTAATGGAGATIRATL